MGKPLVGQRRNRDFGFCIQATIQKIIIDLYKLDDNDNYDWKSIEMDAPTFNEEEVLHGNYQINTIDRIADKETLGKISKVPIPV